MDYAPIDLSALANTIREELHPIHRGVTLIGKNRLAVFGNRGYGNDECARELAKFMHRSLVKKGLGVSEIVTCEDSYTWLIVATGESVNRQLQTDLNRRLWKRWAATCSRWPKSLKRDFQFRLALDHIEGLGGGFTDETLRNPLNPKAPPLSNGSFVRDLMLDHSEGLEELCVLLGGVPFQARITNPPIQSSDETYERHEDYEMIVLLENVGSYATAGEGTNNLHFGRGDALICKDFGDRHPTDGRRMLKPINPMTGEPELD